MFSSEACSISSKHIYKKRDWGDLALAFASSGDAEARPPLPRTQPLPALRFRVPQRPSRQYAHHTHHEGPQPLRPLPLRFLRQMVPIHLLLLRLRWCGVAGETKKMKMMMMMMRRSRPRSPGCGARLIQRGSGDDWPFLRLPSTCSLADGANGPSSQWVWLDWGDTRSLLWNPNSRRGLSKTYARLMLVSFHLEGKNNTKILKKTIIQTVFNFFDRRNIPKK